MIGLVGGIGSGKSRVAGLMAEKGAQVLDADAVGHALLDQPPARDQVVTRFGQGVLARQEDPSEPPTVDRRTLAAVVFANEGERKALEAILHPRMRQTFEKAIARAARKRQVSAVVLDAAVLFEAKWHDLCDVVVFVDAPEDVRLARLASSRGWSAEDVSSRERAQLPLDAKRGRADFVLDNASDDAALAAALGALWEKLVRKPRAVPTRPARPRPAPPAPDQAN